MMVSVEAQTTSCWSQKKSGCGHHCPDRMKTQLRIKKGKGPVLPFPLGGGMRVMLLLS